MRLKRRWQGKATPGYIAVVLACFAAAMMAGWYFSNQVDNAAYDWLFRLNPPAGASPQAIVLAIDDASIGSLGGMRNLRGMLAQALDQIAAAQPALVAIDILLADRGDPAEDARLAQALQHTPNVVLATDFAGGQWENPAPQFNRYAVAEGTTIADEKSADGVTRQIPLEEAENRERHWALSLEAFRIASGARRILESPEDLQIAGTVIPARRSDFRFLRVAYLRDGIPNISLKTLLRQPALAARFRGKAVFIGVNSNTAARDRVFTPFGDRIAGVEVNAQAFETLRRRDFYVDARNDTVLAFCVGVALLAGLIFAYFSGPLAYSLGACLLAAGHAVPYELFQRHIVFPYLAPLSCAWLTVVGAAIYQHFVVRRDLRRSEEERTRYRQAIHFVTHEMRTPLTAIQGSSELIGRYNLNDEKRKQIAQMINSESKRLARMIQTFLDIERLSDGQMELKRDPFEMRVVVEACLDRVRPLADRKAITMRVEGDLEGAVSGDRELLEYAIYNLLTNAVKYSSSRTEVHVASRPDRGQLRLSVKDQGMGMDEKELKKIFQKFYRTKRAEASGEQGSGIGLSIVDQIVQYHGGHMEVTSSPGQGSCFTVVLPALAGDRKPSPVSSQKG